MHSSGPDRNDHPHAHSQRAHAAHRPHPPPHGPRRSTAYRRRRWLARLRHQLSGLGDVLFRTRLGNLSRPKIISLGIVCIAVLYVAVVRGFFPLDVASPWIESALEQQFGPGHKVRVGRTQLHHDESGAAVLRVHEIQVFGPGGKVIASAPSAEVGLEGTNLLTGTLRARRIDLVGAETKIQLGTDGRVAVFAGRNASPLTADAAGGDAGGATAAVAGARSRPKAEPFHYPQLMRWLDALEKSGFDGVSLASFGLKDGTLVVEDSVTGRSWNFRNVNIQLSRPPEGGLLFAVSSSSTKENWQLTVTVGPVQEESRAIDVVASNLAPGDLMLAAGYADADFVAETPLSGILRARVAQDGRLLAAAIQGAAAAGSVGRPSEPEGNFRVDDTQLRAHFDPERRAIVFDPLLIQAGANRFALSGIVAAPKAGETAWPFAIERGVLFLTTGRDPEAPLVMDNVTVRGVYEPAAQRLVIQQGELAGATTSGAFSGSISFGAKPMLALGIAASAVPVSAAKRLWPAPVAPSTRPWALERIEQGFIERLLIAVNVPLEAVGKQGVELPDSAIRFEMTATGVAFRPTADLPMIRDAQVSAVVTGRSARVRIAKAVVDTPQGRRIRLTDGAFDVPNHLPANPTGTIQFRFEGPADAVAEIAASDTLRGVAGFAVDPATAKGTASALVRLSLTFRREVRGDEVDYNVDGDLKDFAADRVVRGQRVEGVNAKVSVTPAVVQVKGEGRVAGAASTFEFRKTKAAAHSEFRLVSTLDEGVRARIGVELAPWLRGPVRIRAHGRTNERETRIDVDADLTAATVNDLVPGWQKAAGRASKAAFRLVERKDGIKLEDVNVSGSGVTLRGSIELDAEGGFASANLPVFHLSEKDKASLRAERAADGALRVTVRGEALDARGAIRGLTEGPGEAAPGQPQRPRDLDLELRLGAATGYNNEVARQLELRIVRRNGTIRNFALMGKIGRNANVVGELRARNDGRPALYVTTNDAGALFRFADFYTRVYGGEAWIVLDTPNTDGTPQDGLLHVREFVIRGEPGLDRLQAAAPPDALDARRAKSPPTNQGIAFMRMQIDFSRTPGRFTVREGLLFGPTIGATVDGMLDYARDRVALRGTFIPAFGLNNLFGQIPVVGLFLGGPKEGLFALTFEIVGPASAPTLRVNPMSAAAPGFLRKLFEFRAAPDAPPTRPLNR